MNRMLIQCINCGTETEDKSDKPLCKECYAEEYADNDPFLTAEEE